jgi:hypothetical protein
MDDARAWTGATGGAARRVRRVVGVVFVVVGFWSKFELGDVTSPRTYEEREIKPLRPSPTLTTRTTTTLLLLLLLLLLRPLLLALLLLLSIKALRTSTREGGSLHVVAGTGRLSPTTAWWIYEAAEAASKYLRRLRQARNGKM